MGTVFCSASSICILSQLCIILTRGKVNKKRHQILAWVLCDARKSKPHSLRLSTPRQGSRGVGYKSRQTRHYDGALLAKETGKLNKNGSSPLLLTQVRSAAVTSLGPRVQNESKPAANPALGVRSPTYRASCVLSPVFSLPCGGGTSTQRTLAREAAVGPRF